MRYILIFILLLGGCSVKKVQTLSSFKCGESKNLKSIGVEIYFNIPTDEIAIIGKDGYIFVYPDIKSLLNSCIAYYVSGCLYPWECVKEPKRVVKIEIESLFFNSLDNSFESCFMVNSKFFCYKGGDNFKEFIKSFSKFIASKI